MLRREFLKWLAFTLTTAGCSRFSDGFAATGEHSRAHTSASKARIWTWLRMFATKGTSPVPTSEDVYLARRPFIHVAMPLNGGDLQANGSWLQEPWKTQTEWAQTLRGIAKRSRQLYMPGVGNDPEGVKAVLESPALMERAAANLVRLATERYDAPWDGVVLDFERIPPEYSSQLSLLLRTVASAIKDAGLLVCISTRGRTGDEGADPPDSYTCDFSVVAELADYVDLRCQSYWVPRPRSISPIWWQEACLRYAFDKGIRPDRVVLGPGCFAKLWFDSDEGHADQITYEEAIRVIEQARSQLEWVESGECGPVREQFALVGDGHLWLHDAQTLPHTLRLIDTYGLLGLSLFSPGMDDPLQWEVIKEWMFPHGL